MSDRTTLAEVDTTSTSAAPVAPRRAMRAERHRRRRLAGVCVLAVAACLAVTVVILGIARNRTGGPLPAGSGTVLALDRHPPPEGRAGPPGTIVGGPRTSGAPAPEGGPH